MSAKSESNFLTVAKDLIAGSVGGIAQCLSGHPLDTVKVRLQTQPTTVPLKYNGMVDCFKKTIAEEGALGLYKGVQSPLVGMAALNSVLFVAYGQAKALVANDKGELTIPRYFAAGALGGIAVAFVEGPVDFFKSQLQTQHLRSDPSQKYTGLVDCAKKIFSRHGVRGVYQGLDATLLRDIPANAVYFGFYELARKTMTKEGQQVKDLPAWKVLIAGGLGGVSYWLFTYPIDVIKSTIQTDSVIPSQRKYNGIIDCSRKILAADGFAGFWKGVTPCLLRSFPANAVCFFTYEWCKGILGA